LKGVFHATLIGKKEDKSQLSLDARTSDAIALAVRVECRIYATETVMSEASVVLDSPPSKAFTNKRGQLLDYTLEELELLFGSGPRKRGLRKRLKNQRCDQ